MSIRPRDSRLAERPKTEAGESKEVDLTRVGAFLRKVVAPAIDDFGDQIGYFFGEQRGKLPTNEAVLRIEEYHREKWLNEAKPLEHFVNLLAQDGNALMVVPGWTETVMSDEEEVERARVSLIHPTSKNKFKARVGKDRDQVKRLTQKEREMRLFVLVILAMKGSGLIREPRMNIDPAKQMMEEDKALTKEIRIFAQEVKADPAKGFIAKNYVGIDIKRISTYSEDGYTYHIKYTSPERANIFIRYPSSIGITIDESSFDRAFECLEQVAERFA